MSMSRKLGTAFRRSTPFFFGAPVMIWQLLFLCVPLLLIIGLSVLVQDDAGIYHVSLEHFVSFLSTPYLTILFRSGLLAIFTAIASLLICYPIAYIITFKLEALKIPALFLLIVPFWTNFLLHVYAWYFVLERGGVVNTILLWLSLISEPLTILNTPVAVAIMMVYSYFPFMVLPLYAVLDKFDHSLIEASMDLGATWGQTLRKIIIPVTLPGIISGFFLVFIPAFAEFAIPELIGGDKRMFVGTVITQYVLGALTMVKGAAFTLFSSLFLGVLALLVYAALRRLGRLV